MTAGDKPIRSANERRSMPAQSRFVLECLASRLADFWVEDSRVEDSGSRISGIEDSWNRGFLGLAPSCP
jgi:hypothetical protein